MQILKNNDLEELKECSGAIWRTFKDLCTAAESMTDKAKFIDMVLVVFRDKVMEYKGKAVYSYAVRYAQDLTYEIERLLYPGKVVKSNYQEVKRMEYDKFCNYMKNPNPGDLITVMQDSRNLARVKIRTVISA